MALIELSEVEKIYEMGAEKIHALAGVRATRIGSFTGRPTAIHVGQAVEVEEASAIRVSPTILRM